MGCVVFSPFILRIFSLKHWLPFSNTQVISLLATPVRMPKVRPLNLADACILRSDVKCKHHRLLPYKRFKWTDSIYVKIVKGPSTWPWIPSILSVFKCICVSRVIRCLKGGTYLSNKGLTFLLKTFPLLTMPSSVFQNGLNLNPNKCAQCMFSLKGNAATDPN